jgi:hypothetical protein
MLVGERKQDRVIDEFIVAACVPRDAHASGTLDEAEELLSAHPELAVRDIHVAAIVGDPDAVRLLLSCDGGLAMARGGAYGWDALTYLCFSPRRAHAAAARAGR